MNPALLNYLQQQGASQGEQGIAQNPYDDNIRRAVEGARESLGMTQKQQDQALRSSMLAFANNMSQQPKQTGFWKNFASVGQALNPAIQTFDQEENAALSQNNNLANQILEYQVAEQKRQEALKDQQFWHQHAGDQLSEQRRSHNLMDSFRRDQLDFKQSNVNSHGSNLDSNSQELQTLLDNAEQLVKETGTNGHRGLGGRTWANIAPGGSPLNKEQAQINALGDVLKGKLFNMWGYRNQAEFEHVPSVSADNPPEVNMAIIKQLKSLILNSSSNNHIGGVTDSVQNTIPNFSFELEEEDK